MNINGSVALVTGSNRGLGRAFAQRLIERGAAKVYAAARRPETVDLPGVEPLRLDITGPAQISAAAERAGDITLLVNNAGVQSGVRLTDGDLGALRTELETHLSSGAACSSCCGRCWTRQTRAPPMTLARAINPRLTTTTSRCRARTVECGGADM